MPDRSRRARHEPPTTWDHILSHPVEIAAAIWWALLGVVVLAGLLPGVPGVSRGIDALWWPVGAALGVAVGGGGVLTILGACWPGERLDIAWRIERYGLTFAAAGWLSYLVILLTSRSVAIFTITMALSMISGAILRLIALRGVEHDQRQDIDDAGMSA